MTRAELHRVIKPGLFQRHGFVRLSFSSMASGSAKLRRHQTRSFWPFMNIGASSRTKHSSGRTNVLRLTGIRVIEHLRITLQHVAAAAGTAPILRIISSLHFKSTTSFAFQQDMHSHLFQRFGRHPHVLSHVICLGQEPILYLLDARLGHFSDPFLDVPLSCFAIFRLPAVLPECHDHFTFFQACGHLLDTGLWPFPSSMDGVEGLAAGHVSTRHLTTTNPFPSDQQPCHLNLLECL